MILLEPKSVLVILTVKILLLWVAKSRADQSEGEMVEDQRVRRYATYPSDMIFGSGFSSRSRSLGADFLPSASKVGSKARAFRGGGSSKRSRSSKSTSRSANKKSASPSSKPNSTKRSNGRALASNSRKTRAVESRTQALPNKEPFAFENDEDRSSLSTRVPEVLPEFVARSMVPSSSPSIQRALNAAERTARRGLFNFMDDSKPAKLEIKEVIKKEKTKEVADLDASVDPKASEDSEMSGEMSDFSMTLKKRRKEVAGSLPKFSAKIKKVKKFSKVADQVATTSSTTTEAPKHKTTAEPSKQPSTSAAPYEIDDEEEDDEWDDEDDESDGDLSPPPQSVKHFGLANGNQEANSLANSRPTFGSSQNFVGAQKLGATQYVSSESNRVGVTPNHLSIHCQNELLDIQLDLQGLVKMLERLAQELRSNRHSFPYGRSDYIYKLVIRVKSLAKEVIMSIHLSNLVAYDELSRILARELYQLGSQMEISQSERRLVRKANDVIAGTVKFHQICLARRRVASHKSYETEASY